MKASTDVYACLNAPTLLVIEPEFVALDLQGISPVDYVMVHNYHRRHLTVAQRAMSAANYKAYLVKHPTECLVLPRPCRTALMLKMATNVPSGQCHADS